ncbi:hypothetical protein [Candidatus Deianiraea vastatrix]|uniref:Uncharacterized protein n=1 Tax=Candidatus Deianiraea vastatrix TaxID=2163644 RepID=A0A5B8XDN5_9RICK|nr:hypothetical protein [Candidatus Deianiraea vastatrix]QED23469.1 hypothetical protein Deia_00677 [Candidatus Deianiraea vastatrix]
MLIKITLKKFLIFLLVFLSIISLYLYRTNWFFDRKIHKLAKPLLRSVMESGHYRIAKDIPCKDNTTATIFCMDINKLLLNLSQKGYNVMVSMLKVTELPSTPMRMSDNHHENEIFNNDKEITCDRERRFDWLKERHDNKLKLLKSNSNARFYLFFEKASGTNYNVLLDNVKKYQDQIFPIKLTQAIPLNYGTYWIIKYKYYYYLAFETNGVSSHHQHKAGERHLIFKKLTLSELKNYDNGSYWKLIKEYNINID